MVHVFWEVKGNKFFDTARETTVFSVLSIFFLTRWRCMLTVNNVVHVFAVQ